MRTRIAVVVMGLGIAAASTVVAVAGTAANGLPSYTNGYTTWKKLNRKPITAPGAHNGIKNVFTSKARRANGRFPSGTVIVKSIAAPGERGLPTQVAVMRKIADRWQWIEYTRTGQRYGVLAKGQLCVDCHMQAKARDWVFTR